ncbi:MurR/RpiR family transcriptional regulator [Embleya sp. NBC_00896]|uniref:MurR/RpiR family transcriptional regulator n=1 Tax=Embleya sp. NBC_00896 TaxID=2975961 RepID=UPI002F918B59|nr:MurR/RpiR family transcriptional regulator [Embleya sp. NBC_00896]
MSEQTQNPALARLQAAVRDQWDELSPAERNVARYLTHCSPEQVLFASAQDLGSAIGTSNATVVRTLQRLGLGGLSALKRDIAADFSTDVAPEVRLRQRITQVGQDLDGIRARVYDEATERLEHSRANIDADAFRRAVELLADATEVLAYGVGASELAGRHLALKLNRMGRRARFVGTTGFGLADELLALRREDVVVMFVPGRLLRDMEVLLDRARVVGAGIVVVTDELVERLADDADVVLYAPHTPTGITAESLGAIVLSDALLLAVASLDETRSVEHSHQLTVLRTQLLEPREGRPRR